MIRDKNRPFSPQMVIWGLLTLGFWASPAAAQLAPWQQPPGANNRTDPSNGPSPLPEGEGTSDRTEPAPSLDSPDLTPPPWASEEYEQEGTALGFRPGYLSNLFCESVHDRFWLRSEFLGWWTKGFATPPLLTTSPPLNLLAPERVNIPEPVFTTRIAPAVLVMTPP